MQNSCRLQCSFKVQFCAREAVTAGQWPLWMHCWPLLNPCTLSSSSSIINRIINNMMSILIASLIVYLKTTLHFLIPTMILLSDKICTIAHGRALMASCILCSFTSLPRCPLSSLTNSGRTFAINTDNVQCPGLFQCWQVGIFSPAWRGPFYDRTPQLSTRGSCRRTCRSAETFLLNNFSWWMGTRRIINMISWDRKSALTDLKFKRSSHHYIYPSNHRAPKCFHFGSASDTVLLSYSQHFQHFQMNPKKWCRWETIKVAANFLAFNLNLT